MIAMNDYCNEVLLRCSNCYFVDYQEGEKKVEHEEGVEIAEGDHVAAF